MSTADLTGRSPSQEGLALQEIHRTELVTAGSVELTRNGVLLGPDWVNLRQLKPSADCGFPAEYAARILSPHNR